MSEAEVREGTVADAAAIAAVHDRSWQQAYRGIAPDELLDNLDQVARTERWHGTLERDEGRVLVAELDGEVVGVVHVLASRDAEAGPRCGEIEAIHLDPRVWDRGIGRALMEAALAHLADEGFSEVTLWVLVGNERAMRFYDRCGFAPDGAERINDGRGVPLAEVRYRRPLPA